MICFQCPKCGATMGSPESMALQTVECPACGSLVKTPPSPQSAGDARAEVRGGLRVAPLASSAAPDPAVELARTVRPAAGYPPTPCGGYAEPMPRPAYSSRQSQSSSIMILLVIFVGVLGFVGGFLIGKWQGQDNMDQLLSKAQADMENQRIELQTEISRLKGQLPPPDPSSRGTPR
jgi:DNA-directed RNA polymerase subunit RPC12/RpoP